MGWFKRKRREKARIPAAQATKCIGRDGEIRLILDQFEKTSSATLIYGDPAIGKTTLLKKIREILEGREGIFVGIHEAEGTEDTLLYALAKLLENIQRKSPEDYVTTLWQKLKDNLGLDSFNRFASDLLKTLNIQGAELPDFLRKKFSITIDEKRVPTLNRDVFLSSLNTLLSQSNVKVVLIIDNPRVAFEEPVPEHVWERYKTLRNILEKIGDISNLHILISWKHHFKTNDAFSRISSDFREYGHELIPLGKITEGKTYQDWLEKDCLSYRALSSENEKMELLDLCEGLPVVASEWIKEEKPDKTLNFNELCKRAKNVKDNKYEYLLGYIEIEGAEFRNIIFQFSCIPFNVGMTSFQVAELVEAPEYPASRCFCPPSTQKSTFLNLQEKCIDILDKAVAHNILKKNNQEYIFEHETKKEYIKSQALQKPTPYLSRAFSFYLSHTGFWTNEHPDAPFYALSTCKLLEEFPGTSSEKSLLKPLTTFMANAVLGFDALENVSGILGSPGFDALPSQMRVFVLSEAVKFSELAKEKDVDRRLVNTINETELTPFQTLSIARALTNATNHYGRLDKLTEMKGCLDVSEKLYQKHPSAELALVYASALTNATISSRNKGSE